MNVAYGDGAGGHGDLLGRCGVRGGVVFGSLGKTRFSRNEGFGGEEVRGIRGKS